MKMRSEFTGLWRLLVIYAQRMMRYKMLKSLLEEACGEHMNRADKLEKEVMRLRKERSAFRKTVRNMASWMAFMALITAAYGVVIWICYDFWVAFILFLIFGVNILAWRCFSR